jgi:hypothetical protein
VLTVKARPANKADLPAKTAAPSKAVGAGAVAP